MAKTAGGWLAKWAIPFVRSVNWTSHVRNVSKNHW